MQQLPEGVRATVNSIHKELTRKNDRNGDGGPEAPKPSAKKARILSFRQRMPSGVAAVGVGGSEAVFAGR
jgi:hypothetical protein